MGDFSRRTFDATKHYSAVLVEQGRHPDLMAARGRYWSLLRRQQLLDAVESDTLETDVTTSTI